MKVICDHCPEKVLRTNLSRHQKSYCRRKDSLFPCLCGEQVLGSRVREHRRKCMSFIKHQKIACPTCGELVIQTNLRRHILRKHPQAGNSPGSRPDSPVNTNTPPPPPPGGDGAAHSKPTLIRTVLQLQDSGRFPPCNLQNLSLLPTVEQVCTSRPCLIDPAECWGKETPTDEVQLAVWKAIRASAQYDVLKDGNKLSKTEEKIAGISKAIFQAMSPFTSQSRSAKYSIMNIPLKKLSALVPPSSIRSRMHLAADEFLISANLAPAGAYVDLHIDQNRHGLSQTVDACKKIWLLYPPTKDNLEAFSATAGEEGRLTKCSDKLQDGYIVETDPSNILHIPPGWLHATFTTLSGILIGINFAALETLEFMGFSLSIHLQYFEQDCVGIEEDLEVYVDCMKDCLERKHPHHLEIIIKSWVAICCSVQQISPVSEGRRLLEYWEQRGLQSWEVYSTNLICYCPACNTDVDNVYNHILNHHRWSVDGW
ncbi:hypothetical protein AJ80_09856 [Polytolypa hystricis UAMH7299]|uniref:JmjC domain-containing protein n=1 Tax=Polytolypa hystricis (strain UAMH7299) TaxID=1447883 RepID=A0A2B7WI01_POLH7|nr:hypothetical protein AJ80_09856 [Polytolypa hystricis UAMH7299]